MPDILSFVSAAQAQNASPSLGAKVSSSQAGETRAEGFQSLLQALGVPIPAAAAEELSELSSQDTQELEVLALALIPGAADQGIGIGTALASQVPQAFDSNQFDTMLADLEAYLQTNLDDGAPIGQLGEVLAELRIAVASSTQTAIDMPAAVPAAEAVGLETPVQNQSQQTGTLEASIGSEQTESLEPSIQPILQAWVEQLPADLRQALSRLLEAGKGLPSAADVSPLESANVAALDGQAPALQQLVAILHAIGVEVPPVTAPDPAEAGLAAFVASKGGEPKLALGPVTSGKQVERRGAAAGLQTPSPAAATALLDETPLAADESFQLRPAVQQLQQAMGQAAPAPWSVPVTAASAAALQAGALAPVAPAAGAAILAPPGDAAWSQALGERLLWMVGRDIHRAELRLNPPQLGPMEVRISVQNDQASVSFTAQHPFTREALEASIPRLREMLAESNLNLSSVDVGQRDAGESRNGNGRDSGNPAGGHAGFAAEETDAEPRAMPTARVLSGLVDDFA